MTQPTYVFLAGIRNSGPQHWQRLWNEDLGGLWVEHADWENPERDAWVLERPKHARHASVPRPPAEETQNERKGWRHRRRDRATAATGWTISPAEAAGMSAAGRRLHGLDDPS